MFTLNFKEYCLDIPKEIYFPSDDTELMLEALEKEINGNFYNKVLDMGCGNALVSLLLYDRANKVYAVDINPTVINYLKLTKKKYKLNKIKIIKSDLFKNITKEKFDIIIFNPPYVCSENLNSKHGIDVAVNGGEDGREVIEKFIENLDTHLTDNGVCFLLVSSINKISVVKKKLKEKNFNIKIINSKRIFFEELNILKIKKIQPKK